MPFLAKTFIHYKQLNSMDCGPTCLRMIARSYGRYYKADDLRHMSGFNREGVSLLGISETAEKIGFKTRGVRIYQEQLEHIPLPAILHWNQNHFVVLVEVKAKCIKIADPSSGFHKYKKDEFLKYWAASQDKQGKQLGVALLLEPTDFLFERETESGDRKFNWLSALQYIKDAKWQIWQIFIALLMSSLLSLIFPFLTQGIVDDGINVQNIQYVILVLIAQAMLVFSQTIIGFIRSSLLLKVSNVLNIRILSDFWIKLTRIPISYFDIHKTGDTIQRIGDHKNIQGFLTGPALSTLFSLFNFVIYAIVLIIYSTQLFFIFCIGSFIYFFWIHIFMNIRRKINYSTFHLSAGENNITLQIIQGMQEIRLNNAEKRKRWEWENVQAKIFKLNFKNLNYSQLQSAGATFINSLQGIFVSFIVAKLVIDGRLTLGAMMAVQYIIGQLSAPVQQLVGFIQSFQDARISMERLNEIHRMDDEEKLDRIYVSQLPDRRDIIINKLSFTYPGAGNDAVLEHINLVIPENKVTAIVGVSGSGKTTLVKILLKIFEEYEGSIKIGGQANEGEAGLKFGFISHSYWRSVCGAVLQDGYVFEDSIARNVVMGADEIDYERLIQSCMTANIHSFIESLPNGYYTKLGAEGIGLSQGQKQRILIARAVYKNPYYLFFDEATNALDANNEREIVDNLQLFFRGKTVVIVAHRLSTVRNADKIVLLDRGRIFEEGTHESLVALRGKYYELVKNQLELGS